MKKNFETIKLSKKMYMKESILKASYVFGVDYYFYIDEDDENYLIKVESKGNNKNDSFEKEFINEVISQTVRYNIMMQTKNVRELILGRALATTMVNDASKYENEKTDTNLNNILIDWFDKYDIR